MARAEPQGFTLVEVLVAFSIAAIMLLPLMRGFAGGIDSATRTSGVTEAALIAESTLEFVGSGRMPVDGLRLDERRGNYRVEASVHRFSGAALTKSSSVVAPYEVLVTVHWQEGAHSRSLALRTLRLGPAPAPAGQQP